MIGYPAIEPWTEFATRVLAPNPGPMTLDGTNTFVLRRPGWHRVIVVDPGPDDSPHLLRVTSLGQVELILLTHHHIDHAQSARRLAAMTGAPLRAADPSLCVAAGPLLDSETINAGGIRMRVMSAPGHTADSVCLHLPDDQGLEAEVAPAGSVLTGDTILGRGSTVITGETGSLRDYLQTLERLRRIGRALVLPGHGPSLNDLNLAATAGLEHRLTRLREVQAAVERIERAASAREVTVEVLTDLVYPNAAPEIRGAAEANLVAQLEYLAYLAEAGTDLAYRLD